MTFSNGSFTSEEIPLSEITRHEALPKRGNGLAVVRKAPAAPELLPVRSATEFRARTAPDYLLKGVIHRGDLSVWFGPSGCGKTFTVLHLAHCIATGRKMFGRRVKDAPVLIFALEGSSGLANRVDAVQREYGTAPNLFLYDGGHLQLFGQPAIVNSVIATIKDCRAGLVIFDTLSRVMAGADENNSRDMSLMVGVFDKIRSETGAHVLIVHHTGKDEARGARGHSSLRASLEVEAEFTRDGDARSMHFTKLRDGDDSKGYGFNLKQVDLGSDDDGDPITTVVLEELGEAKSQPKAARALNDSARCAFDCLTEAIDDLGIPPPALLDLPASILRVVEKSAWVAAYVERQNVTPEAARKAIERAAVTLTARKKIQGHAPYFWVLK